MLNTNQTLQCETIDDRVGVIHLHRPDAANALNVEMAADLVHFLAEIVKTDCRAIILTGKGKHFCAGADLKARKGISNEEWQQQHHHYEQAHRALLDCPIPIIAAVNGAAYGGGLELALACDFIYASETARFALTETTLGIMPGLGGTQLLPRTIGIRHAKELLYLGKPFSAAEALHWGLVNRVCPPEALLDDAIACAQTISRNAPLAIKAVKRAVDEGIDLPLPEALQCELAHYNTLLSTADRSEGINAFNEKRTPVFKGG